MGEGWIVVTWRRGRGPVTSEKGSYSMVASLGEHGEHVGPCVGRVRVTVHTHDEWPWLALLCGATASLQVCTLEAIADDKLGFS